MRRNLFYNVLRNGREIFDFFGKNITMAYSELLAERVRLALELQEASFEEKKMMGGLCFMVDGKMCCGVHFDKKKETDLLMARIGAVAKASVLERDGIYPMDFTGRPMKDYIFVAPEAHDTEEDLAHWVALCLAFNPLAKASKKRKKK